MFSFLNNIPQVTKNFLLLNILLFVLMHVFLASGGIDLSRYLASHYVTTPLFEPYQVISHMFMHSYTDVTHIFFNMFGLVIFGSHLERLWGPKRFFLFYFAAGIGAFVLDNAVNVTQLVEMRHQLSAANINISALDNLIASARDMGDSQLNQSFNEIVTQASQQQTAIDYFQLSLVSGVGASGAIYGLLAAFALLFPNTELYLMFIPIPVKAKFLIGAFVLYEVYKAFSVQTDNINHLAHLGGALIGAILVIYWRQTDRKNFY